ncbi:hypothetical protein [Chryseobacterium fistulae]|uniref:Uncharacterized protein n=1 Tax=Chryseobacterium fistulae TaxID=2675058 RepID=A0A6N4XZM1_9FLAO|nr:hypothetical protein [Chryseobacterium fistulae]CAA7393991.1 hypothetical protein CHRY9393_03604 [Chryseobacterium fistulae]
MSNKNFRILDESEFNQANEFINTYNKTNRPILKLVRSLEIANDFKNLKDKHFINFETTLVKTHTPKLYYIPTLRTAHSLYHINNTSTNYKKIEEDILLHTLKKNYSLDKSIDVFTGVHLYKDIPVVHFKQC